MNKLSKGMPTFSLKVIEGAGDATAPSAEAICQIGVDICVDMEAMENYCFRLISKTDYDLTLLAGVIAYADRTFRRQYSHGWARRIEITMPVSDPDYWNRDGLVGSLQSAVSYLTGDEWGIRFTALNRPRARVCQDVLDIGKGAFVVLPYSGGLDSFAQLRLLWGSELTPICVTTWNRGVAGHRDWYEECGRKHRRVSVPIRFRTTRHPEPSYRTRSFVFLVFAGLAAHLSGAQAILVPENGQGSLGPSLVPFGCESPHRGAHPAFTRRMAQFFAALWDERREIRHPQLWNTKGQVLAELKEKQLLQGWQDTLSCPRDRRNVNLMHRRIQCGVCSSCLLRRMAAHASGVPDPDASYLWTLQAPTLEEALHPRAHRPTNPNDWDIARTAVLNMSELAKKAGAPKGDPAMALAEFELGSGMPSSDTNVTQRLQRLLSTHKTEWEQFIARCGSKSWISKQAELP